MSIRLRASAVALLLAAASLSACTDTTSPLDVKKPDVNAAVDSVKPLVPTLPWGNVTSTVPTLPWG